jgi:hypothetical protein
LLHGDVVSADRLVVSLTFDRDPILGAGQLELEVFKVGASGFLVGTLGALPPVPRGFWRHGSGVRVIEERKEGRDRRSVPRPGWHASSTHPRSGYPWTSCSAAELVSVSPDKE